MSVTILDIMHLPSLQEARIVAGMNGICLLYTSDAADER